MGLTSWEGAPQGKVHKYDVAIAKNYLSDFELAQMQRIVSAYLDMAELQAMRRIPMTMADWEERLGGFLKLWDRDVLQDAGKVTAEIAKAHAESEFENTASCKTGCLRVILIGLSGRLRLNASPAAMMTNATDTPAGQGLVNL